MMPRLILLLLVMWSLGAGLLRGLSRPMDSKAESGWLTLIELVQIEYKPGQRGHSLQRSIHKLDNMRVLNLANRQLTSVPPGTGSSP